VPEKFHKIFTLGAVMKERKPGRNYFTINIDEPYAPLIYETMKTGERDKGTWPEGDISFEEWKQLNFSGMPAAAQQRIKEQMTREVRLLAETLPEETREAYLLCVETEALEEKIKSASYDEAKALMARAISLQKTIKESLSIISSEKRFGTFLIEEGLATPEQIVTALDLQKKSAKTIEKIACEQKMLTHEQILEIFNTHAEISKLFGEAALELGYLSDEQVQKLLSLQMKQRQPIGEILIRLGVLDKKTVQAALAAFYAHREQQS